MDILEHGRLVENINSLINGIQSDYTGPRKAQMVVTYLEQRREDFQNHRQRGAETYERRGFASWIDTLIHRYTQSVFSLNSCLPLKQTGTYAAALGQGIIDDEYMRSIEATSLLAKLTGAAYSN
ncbi:hypothetical protein [Spirosoma oryzae]|uniref:hypothetical protein n=1 Tax=Spirosoma oryzae TaxID=1469603 RepID=UPI000D06755E|nr:hypothetical protein [Spirosoma oryzae]